MIVECTQVRTRLLVGNDEVCENEAGVLDPASTGSASVVEASPQHLRWKVIDVTHTLLESCRLNNHQQSQLTDTRTVYGGV